MVAQIGVKNMAVRGSARLTLAPLRTLIGNERRSLELSGRRSAQALSRLPAAMGGLGELRDNKQANPEQGQ